MRDKRTKTQTPEYHFLYLNASDEISGAKVVNKKTVASATRKIGEKGWAKAKALLEKELDAKS